MFLSTSPEPLPHPPAPSIFIPIISINLQIPLPATPFFSHLYKTPGGGVSPSIHFLFSRFHFPLSSLFSIICGLFGPVAKLNCFLFKKMQTLCAEHRGWHAFQWHRHSCLCSDEGKSPDRRDRCRTTHQRFQGRVSSFAFRVSYIPTFRRSDVQTLVFTLSDSSFPFLLFRFFPTGNYGPFLIRKFALFDSYMAGGMFLT
jgi:hypothetical protein